MMTRKMRLSIRLVIKKKQKPKITLWFSSIFTWRFHFGPHFCPLFLSIKFCQNHLRPFIEIKLNSNYLTQFKQEKEKKRKKKKYLFTCLWLILSLKEIIYVRISVMPAPKNKENFQYNRRRKCTQKNERRREGDQSIFR